MAVKRVDFNNLPDNVRSRLDQSCSGFFGGRVWFEHFIEQVSKVSGWDSFCVYDDQSPSSACMPLLAKREHGLRIIGSLANYYSPLYSIFTRTSSELSDGFFVQALQQLSDWDLFELRPLSLEEHDRLDKHLTAARIAHLGFFGFGNWYLPLDGRDFKTYFDGLSSQLKNTVSRKRKKFFKEPGARIEVLQHVDQLPEALSAYQAVYNASWKVAEPYPEFVPNLIRRTADLGALRLGVAYLDDQPIAVQFWIVADQCAYIFKLAYDEAFKSYSAGTLLTTQLMEHVIDVDRVEQVDYLCGDDHYKKDWMSHRRERWGIWIFNTRSPRGLFEYLKEYAKFYIKKLLEKRNRPAAQP